jgi:hypothetical protein
VAHRPINAFAEEKLDHAIKLAWARDLQRMWSDVLQEPLPTDLRIARLEQARAGGQPLVVTDRCEGTGGRGLEYAARRG